MNSSILNRRNFLGLSAGAAGLVLLPDFSLAQAVSTAAPAMQNPAETPATKKAKPDPLKPELVKEFVGAGHSDLDKTKTMLAETPGLLNASWDWGGGDFEMAIGGAGHMGHRDIALFLIGQGGRFDIFVAAMLGRLDIVKAMLSGNPNLANSKGPHGITLLTHAQKGGTDAKDVVDFLKSL